jgi:hypothetical protein
MQYSLPPKPEKLWPLAGTGHASPDSPDQSKLITGVLVDRGADSATCRNSIQPAK